MYNYDDNGALIITHFSPDTVTAACGVYILDGRAAWTEDQRLVEGCPPCLQAAQNADQADNSPPSLSRAAEKCTTWPAVQAFKNFHSRPGIAGVFRPWQQLQGMQLESHRVVPGHSSLVLEAQDRFQTQLGVRRPECRLGVLRGNPEALVESWQELLQHPVGFQNASRVCQPEFGDQTVLKGAGRALHSTLPLRRQGEDHLDPQLLHSTAELGGHPREAGAGCVSEDPVPVGVQGDGSAATLYQGLHQQEVIVGVLLLAEDGVDHRAGGIVHGDQQRERRYVAQLASINGHANCSWETSRRRQ